MPKAIIIFISVICAAAFAGTACCEQKDKPADDSFLVSAVNAVFDKVNQYSSGEKGILLTDYDKPEAPRRDYETDALGRKIPEPTIRTGPAKKTAEEAVKKTPKEGE
jgi:hypothetical protein